MHLFVLLFIHSFIELLNLFWDIHFPSFYPCCGKIIRLCLFCPNIANSCKNTLKYSQWWRSCPSCYYGTWNEESHFRRHLIRAERRFLIWNICGRHIASADFIQYCSKIVVCFPWLGSSICKRIKMVTIHSTLIFTIILRGLKKPKELHHWWYW